MELKHGSLRTNEKIQCAIAFIRNESVADVRMHINRLFGYNFRYTMTSLSIYLSRSLPFAGHFHSCYFHTLPSTSNQRQMIPIFPDKLRICYFNVGKKNVDDRFTSDTQSEKEMESERTFSLFDFCSISYLIQRFVHHETVEVAKFEVMSTHKCCCGVCVCQRNGNH